MTVNVWAEAVDVPGHVCSDARLRGGNVEDVAYPKGTSFGQAGWNIGMTFKSLADLADKLYRKPKNESIRRGQITRLGIHVHGTAGKVYFEGQKKKQSALTAANIQEYHEHLHDIGLSTRENATILIVGCLAGQGWEGRELLIKLSRVWPGRKVVAFTTVGYVAGAEQLRTGETCTEPGMRDTDSTSPALTWQQQQELYGPIWNDLAKLPWASETSPHAKVAMDGMIIRKPTGEKDDPPVERRPGWLDKELWYLWKNYQELKRSAHPDNKKLLQLQVQFMNLRRERARKGLHYVFPGESAR